MKICKKPFDALIKLVIHLLENQHVSKYEAIFIITLKNMLEIGLLLSSNFNFHLSHWEYTKVLFRYAQLFNTTALLKDFGLEPQSMALLLVLASVSTVLFILNFYVYYVFYRGKTITSSQKVVIWIFELISKYMGYCFSIPFLHCFITAIGSGLPQTIISSAGIAMISFPLLIERLLIQEDNFLETHYLGKRNTSLNFMTIIYFIFMMIFESHFPSTDHRLPYTLVVVGWQVCRLVRLITFDYYFFDAIQNLALFWKGLLLPVSFILLLDHILDSADVRTVSPIELLVSISLSIKIVQMINNRYEQWLLGNCQNLNNGYQVVHVIKLLINQTQLYSNKGSKEFDYSNADLLSQNVLFHKGIIASDFLRSYKKHSISKFWKQEELYDPATFSFFKPKWHEQRYNSLKETPSNSVIAIKHFLKSLYVMYTNKFPKNTHLHLSFASFLLHYLRLTPAVILECHVLKEHLEKQSDIRISISRERLVGIVNTIQERLSRERSDLVFSNIDIKGISELEWKYNEMVQLIGNYVQDYVGFLTEMAEDTVNFELVYKSGKKLLVLRKKIEEIFNKYLCENPFSMAAYAEFLRAVLSDDYAALELAKKCQRELMRLEAYNRDERECVEVDLLFDKDSSIIQASGLMQNLGKILRANPACERLFGYNLKELEMLNLRVLSPRLISIQHDNFLTGYIESGRENIMYTNRRLFGRTKGGFIFPLTLLVKPQVDLSTGAFLFFGYIKSANTKNEYIITDQFGFIDSASKALGEALGLTRSFLDENLAHIQLICPETSILFDISNNLMQGKTSTQYTHNNSNESECYDAEENENNLNEGDYNKEIGLYNRKNTARNRMVQHERARMFQETDITFKAIKKKDPKEYVPKAQLDKCKNIVEFYTNQFQNRDSNKGDAELFFNLDQKYITNLNAKINELKETKEFCLIQGSVEELRTSKNKIKMYVFKFTDIDDLLIQKTRKLMSRHNRTTLHQSTHDRQLERRETASQSIPKNFVKYPTSHMKDPPILTELTEENEKPEQSSYVFSEDREIHKQFHTMTKSQLPRFLNDVSAIHPPKSQHVDLSNEYGLMMDIQNENLTQTGRAPPRNLLQTNRNDGSFEGNASYRSGGEDKKSTRSHKNEKIAGLISEEARLESEIEDLRAVRFTIADNKTTQNPQFHQFDSLMGTETNRGTETVRGTEIYKGHETGRSKMATSRISTDRYFDTLAGTNRAFIDSQKNGENNNMHSEVRPSSIQEIKNGNEEGNSKKKIFVKRMTDAAQTVQAVVVHDPNEREGDLNTKRESSSFVDFTDSLKHPETGDKKLGVADLFTALKKTGAAEESGEKLQHIHRQFDIKSRTSSVTSGSYKANLIHAAIFSPYLPPEFRHSRLTVIGQLVAAIVSLITIIGISLSQFTYLQYSTQILDDVNRLVYYVHSLGNVAYDLQNNGLARGSAQSLIDKATEMLYNMNNSYTNFSAQLELFQSEKPYFFNTFPTFPSQQLLRTVVVDTKYNISLALDQYFTQIQYAAFLVLSNFDDVITNTDRSSVSNLQDEYLNVLTRLSSWTRYFTNNSELNLTLSWQINYQTIAISIILFIFTVLGIYKLLVSLKFINRTLYQLSYISAGDYLMVREQIMRFGRNLNNKISLSNSESTNIQLAARGQKSTKKGGKGNSIFQNQKRRFQDAKVFSFRRALPIFLLFSFYMIIQGSFKAAMDSATTAINLSMENILFFAQDEVNTIDRLVRFKNYTLQARLGTTKKSDLTSQITTLNSRINATVAKYVSVVSELNQIFTEEQTAQLHALIYDDVCPLYPGSNCTNVVSGSFTRGFLTGRVAIYQHMLSYIDQNQSYGQKYFVFQELNQAEFIDHSALMDILTISTGRLEELLTSGVDLLVGLVVGLVLATLFFFWIIWKYTMKGSIEEFTKSRQMLSLLPVTYITKNNRITNFLQRTSSLSFAKY